MRSSWTGCSPYSWRSCATRTRRPCRHCSADLQNLLMPKLRFDLGTVARVMSAQHAVMDDAVAGVSAAAFELPTRLGGWTVAELVAHIGMDMSAVPRYLRGERAVSSTLDAPGYVLACATAATGVDERVRLMSAEARPAELRHLVHESRLEADAVLVNADARFIVPSRLGTIGLADFIATRCVEATVHALDLAAALGTDAALVDDALTVSARVLATALAEKAPGG